MTTWETIQAAAAEQGGRVRFDTATGNHRVGGPRTVTFIFHRQSDAARGFAVLAARLPLGAITPPYRRQVSVTLASGA